NKAVAYAAASGRQSGQTGLYLALSCYYYAAPANTSSALLNGLGSGFKVQAAGSCSNNEHIVATSPALAGLSDTDLSNWSCSTHEVFDSWPSSYQVLAISKDSTTVNYTAGDGTRGAPYIIAKGADLVPVTNVALTPATQKVARGSAATLHVSLSTN